MTNTTMLASYKTLSGIMTQVQRDLTTASEAISQVIGYVRGLEDFGHIDMVEGKRVIEEFTVAIIEGGF
jgi:hypothetical protein